MEVQLHGSTVTSFKTSKGETERHRRQQRQCQCCIIPGTTTVCILLTFFPKYFDFSPPVAGVFSRSWLRGGPACTPRHKWGSRPGSVGRPMSNDVRRRVKQRKTCAVKGVGPSDPH